MLRYGAGRALATRYAILYKGVCANVKGKDSSFARGQSFGHLFVIRMGYFENDRHLIIVR